MCYLLLMQILMTYHLLSTTDAGIDDLVLLSTADVGIDDLPFAIYC